MPNFDGTGPLKRRRVIGRGLRALQAECRRMPATGCIETPKKNEPAERIIGKTREIMPKPFISVNDLCMDFATHGS